MNKKQLLIGTRGSQLSLIQTEIVKKAIEKIYPSGAVTIQTIKTKGDKNMSPIPLDSVGKGWFTKELDKALLEGTIDIAVHSLKDLPEELPDGLVIAAIPEREDAREALVTKENVSLVTLKKGAVIGTDSIRRKVQLIQKRSDVEIKSIRGNVNTRLAKLESGEYDGIVLAVAGLKRLGLESRISEYFELTDIVPSPGQGALAVVIKKENKALFTLLQQLNHPHTVAAVRAERAFSKVFGGGCKTPVGAYAEVKGKKLILQGVVGSLDGKELHKASITGKTAQPELAGEELAKQFLFKGYSPSEHPKFVVITRPQNATVTMQKQIEALGLQTYFYPSITITKNTLTKQSKKMLLELDSFDWVLFTSQNGVRFFLEALNELGIPWDSLANKKIATVGKKTAETVKKYGLPVDFFPSQFTTETLGQEIPDIAGKNILMARATLATPILKKRLEERGAVVTDIPIYNTSYVENNSPEFDLLVKNNQISFLTFTSPSTVTGFLNNIKASPFRDVVFHLTALSIGPVTTKALQRQGFHHIITADTFTINGMIAKLKESIL